MTQSSPMHRVAVVGGGISGLAAAHRLVELNPACGPTLFEATGRLGGVLSTVHEAGFQVEQSADNFITTYPWALALCRRLGLEEELVQTNPDTRRTFVVHRGKLYKLPDGFLMMAPTKMWPMAVTPVLSPLGKLRAGFEYFLPPSRDDRDESMAAFVRRRLGREVFERLVEPLVSGVYAADMEKLSLLATLPRFREMERKHGSLIRAMRKQMQAARAAGRHVDQSGARYSMFVTLQRGLSSLIDALAARLPKAAVRLGTNVVRVEPSGGGWRVETGEGRSDRFDALILATPSHVAAGLLKPVAAELSGDLAGIEHEGTAIVTMAFEASQAIAVLRLVADVSVVGRVAVASCGVGVEVGFGGGGRSGHVGSLRSGGGVPQRCRGTPHRGQVAPGDRLVAQLGLRQPARLVVEGDGVPDVRVVGPPGPALPRPGPEGDLYRPRAVVRAPGVPLDARPDGLPVGQPLGDDVVDHREHRRRVLQRGGRRRLGYGQSAQHHPGRHPDPGR